MTTNNQDKLMAFINELKDNDYQVYVPSNFTTYFHFVKNDKIGYVELTANGYNFSTVHKPCRECGTGYSIHREIAIPTIEMANDCFVLAPGWVARDDVKAIKKYKNWDEYANSNLNKWANYKRI